MLYISRRADDDRYGVVDTDDDVETVASRADIIDAVGRYGLHIEGVQTGVMALGNSNFAPYVQSITIYQDPRYCTALQTKAKTVLGVDIRIFRDEIVFIMLDSHVAQDGLRLRLSDFAKKFCGYAPVRWSPNDPNKFVTLILDDKLEFTGNVPDIGVWGVRWDISEVTNKVFVELLYKDLLDNDLVEFDCWSDFIYDKEDRYRFWRSAGVVRNPVNEEGNDCLFIQQSPDRVDISKRIGAMYKAEFEEIANTDISNTFFSSLTYGDFLEFVTSFLPGGIDALADCASYDMLRDHYMGVFKILKFSSTVSTYTLNRFESYIRFFDAPLDIQALFVRLCHNTAVGLSKYFSSKGWLIGG